MNPNDPRLTRLRARRYRLLWLRHLQQAMEGRDGSLLSDLIACVAREVAALQAVLQHDPDWLLIESYLQGEEARDQRELYIEVYVPRFP